MLATHVRGARIASPLGLIAPFSQVPIPGASRHQGGSRGTCSFDQLDLVLAR
jgi:hypothetical protein